jgi:hypothetical protein
MSKDIKDRWDSVEFSMKHMFLAYLPGRLVLHLAVPIALVFINKGNNPIAIGLGAGFYLIGMGWYQIQNYYEVWDKHNEMAQKEGGTYFDRLEEALSKYGFVGLINRGWDL